jgi:replication-associated recombination protein RarA
VSVKSDIVVHLKPEARGALDLSDEQRIALIRKGCWVGYPRAREILDHVTELMNWPRVGRMPSMLIFGRAGSGKSRLLTRAIDVLPKAQELEDVTIHPVVKIEIPTPVTSSGIYKAILRQLNVPFPRSGDVETLQRLCLDTLVKVQTKVLLLDEIHHLLNVPASAQRQALAQLKHISNVLEISLVAAGTEDAWFALKTDAQLASRFEPFPLPLWSEGKELLQLLTSFVALIPLRKPSMLASMAIGQEVLDRTDGTIGEITKLIQAAAVAAIKSGEERITLETLRATKYISPDEKARMTETVVL